MGKSVQKITNIVSLIASANTWIEDLAVQQLIKTSELEGMLAVAGMPDLHPGRGYPIGAAFFSQHKIYPALVGNDIGCGMGLWQSSLKHSNVKTDKLANRLVDMETPLDESYRDFIDLKKRQTEISISSFDRSLGTIGGGNHFAEFQVIDKIYCQDSMQELGLEKQYLQLLVHSGSRGYGQSILVDHISSFNHDGLVCESPESEDYMSKHNEALRWAELNRELIAKRFLHAIRASGEKVLDVNHNLVCQQSIDGKVGWLHRKGATPSDQGYVVIPGSRGDYTYLVKPTSVETALFSLAHGAGRKWKRGDCQGRLSHKYKKEDLLKTSLGNRVICNDKVLLYDEAPQAYKKCETVVQDLIDAGLIELIARLKPVLTFKTNGKCSG